MSLTFINDQYSGISPSLLSTVGAVNLLQQCLQISVALTDTGKSMLKNGPSLFHDDKQKSHYSSYRCNVQPPMLQAAMPVDAVTATVSRYILFNLSMIAKHGISINRNIFKERSMLKLPRINTDLPVPRKKREFSTKVQ